MRSMVGYAYGSPSGSNATAVDVSDAAIFAFAGAFELDGAVSEANKKLINYDADLLAITDSSQVHVFDIAQSSHDNHTGELDLNNMSAFGFNDVVTDAGAIDSGVGTVTGQVRRLTVAVGAAGTPGNRGVISQITSAAAAIRYYVVATGGTVADTAQGTQGGGS